jgi:hypothetical protein
MNLKTSSVVFASMGILLASCATTNTPVALYAQTANALISIDEGFDQEVEYEFMIGGGQLNLQNPHFMDIASTSALQNDWVEISEILATLKETQRLQNQERILIKMEASILIALASVIDTNQIILSEVDNAALVEAQASLEATKLTIQGLRAEIRTLTIELRQLFRSVNRPTMWDETLVISIHAILTELMPLTEDFQQTLLTILPSLQVIREIFISNIPLSLSPLTEEVLIALDLFESQLATLASLQDFMIGVRQGTRDQIKEIKFLVVTLKSNNQGLTNEQKVALTIKRMAIANQMNQLRTHQEENMGQLESLRDLIDINNLTQLNVILADLIVSAEARQVILAAIQDLFVEANTILQA